MTKLGSSTDWYRLARAQAALEAMGVPVGAEALSRHLPFAAKDIESTLNDATYREFADQFKRRRFGIWAEQMTRENVDVQQLFKPLSKKAVMVVEDALDSDDDKIRMAAARLVFDFNPDLERPVIRHEITNRFSSDEIEQARDIVRKLKQPKVKLPELPNGEHPVN